MVCCTLLLYLNNNGWSSVLVEWFVRQAARNAMQMTFVRS